MTTRSLAGASATPLSSRRLAPSATEPAPAPAPASPEASRKLVRDDFEKWRKVMVETATAAD